MHAASLFLVFSVRSQTVGAEAGGRLSVGLLTPGQGMPGT